MDSLIRKKQAIFWRKTFPKYIIFQKYFRNENNGMTLRLDHKCKSMGPGIMLMCTYWYTLSLCQRSERKSEEIVIWAVALDSECAAHSRSASECRRKIESLQISLAPNDHNADPHRDQYGIEFLNPRNKTPSTSLGGGHEFLAKNIVTWVVYHLISKIWREAEKYNPKN